MMNRKRIVILAAVICCMTLLAAGTTAYFTAEETAYNVITMGSLKMTLHDATLDEEGNEISFPQEGIGGVVPGMTVDKIVYLENTGSVDFFGRISLDKRMTVMIDGEEVQLPVEYIVLDIDTENWTEQDGFYYYNRALAPGETSEKLFTTVTFDPAMGNEYMNARAEIIVHAQAVQSRNNGGSALEAKDWPKVEEETDDETGDDETGTDEETETGDVEA